MMKIQSLSIQLHAGGKSGEVFLSTKTFQEPHSETVFQHSMKETEVDGDLFLKNGPQKKHKMDLYILSEVIRSFRSSEIVNGYDKMFFIPLTGI